MRSVAAGLLASALAAFLAASPVGAIDGVTEINQARAQAGGVTPGDLPGLPVTLSLSGSYRLTSGLSGGSGIEITSGVDDVTIDLGGFTIDGAGATGSGIAALGSDEGVTVRNGIVRDFAGTGISIGGESRVVDVQVEQCTGGIAAGARSIVLRSRVVDAGINGFALGIQSRVAHNASERSGLRGFLLGGASVVSGNSSRDNGLEGFDSSAWQLLLFDNVSLSDDTGISLGLRGLLRGNVVSTATKVGISAGDGSVIDANAVDAVGQAGGGAQDLDGVQCGEGCAVRGNLSNASAFGHGIATLHGTALVDNVASGNRFDGIDCNSTAKDQVCGIVRNTAIANVGLGLAQSTLGAAAGAYKSNTFNANGSGDASPAGLDPGFQNTCSGTSPCP